MFYLNKYIWILIVFSLLSSTACRNTTAEDGSQQKNRIILQPLQFADLHTLQYLKDSIEKFYSVKITIANDRIFPPNCYYKPRNRYRADSTIKWLRQIKPDSIRSIVGITDEDVSTSKGFHNDFGVMGLGYKPGGACIISTVRLKRTANSSLHLKQRLFKVVIHEMGHNFGLPHCPKQSCIMVDAEGKMKLDEEKDLCFDCKRKLKI